MARLWDKPGFVNYLRNRLQCSAYDPDDRPAAFELLKRAQASGQGACNSDRLDEAVRYLSLALAILFDTGTVDTPNGRSVVGTLAKCFNDTGRLAYAFTAYMLLGELHEAAGEHTYEMYLENIKRLAEVAGEATGGSPGTFEDADQFYEESLTLLMNAYMRQGDSLYGLKYGHQLLKVSTRIHGNDHIEVAMTAANLSTACLQLGVFMSAAKFAQQALSIFRDAPNGPAEAIGVASFNLGRVRMSEGRYEEAVLALGRAVEISEAHFGTNDDRTRMARETLREAHRASRTPPSARAYEAVPGQAHSSVTRADGSISQNYRGLPDNDDIEEVIKLGEALRESLVPGPAETGVPNETGVPDETGIPREAPLRKRIPDLPPFPETEE